MDGCVCASRASSYFILLQSIEAFRSKQNENSIIQTISGHFFVCVCILHRNIKLKIVGKPRCRWLNKSLRLLAPFEKLRFCFVRRFGRRCQFSLKRSHFTVNDIFRLVSRFHWILLSRNNMFILVSQQAWIFFPVRISFAEHISLCVYAFQSACCKIIQFFSLFILWLNVVVSFEPTSSTSIFFSSKTFRQSFSNAFILKGNKNEN